MNANQDLDLASLNSLIHSINSLRKSSKLQASDKVVVVFHSTIDLATYKLVENYPDYFAESVGCKKVIWKEDVAADEKPTKVEYFYQYMYWPYSKNPAECEERREILVSLKLEVPDVLHPA